MASQADAFFGGAPGLSWPKASNGTYSDTRLRGVIRGGVIVDEPQVQPLTEMGTGKPRTWPDGRPREQLVVTLRCDGQRGGAQDERNPQNPHDDGRRRLYVKGYMVAAVREALQAAGAQGLRVGGELYVAWVDEQPAKTAGFDPARLWKARYVAPTTAVLQGGAEQQPQGAAGAAAPNPWAPAPAAPPAAPAGQAGGYAPPAYQPPAGPPQGPPADPWGAAPPAPAAPAPAANPWG